MYAQRYTHREKPGPGIKYDSWSEIRYGLGAVVGVELTTGNDGKYSQPLSSWPPWGLGFWRACEWESMQLFNDLLM